MSETTRGKMVADTDGDPLRAGTKIRLRRKVRGLSLKDVAEKCDISIAQLSQIERGASSPSLRLLGQICAAVSMPIG